MLSVTIKPFMLSVAKLSVIKPSVVKLSVVMLNVVAPVLFGSIDFFIYSTNALL
jgi:hypothetical protein